MNLPGFVIVYLGVYVVGRVIYKKYIAKKKIEK